MSNQDKTQLRQYWQSIVQDWQDSGLTQADYCRKHQLKPHQLNYWKSIFCKPQKSPAFIPVATAVPTSSPQMIAAVLPNGVRLEVPVEQHTLLPQLIADMGMIQ